MQKSQGYRYFRLWAVTFFLWFAPLSFAHSDILVKDATVLNFSGTGRATIANVLVSGDRIVRIEDGDIAVPITTMTIDARGRFVMPGLIDMHAHLPGPVEDPKYVEDILFLFLSGGVTTVRSMLGQTNHMKLHNRIRLGEVLGPTLYLASPAFSGAKVSSPAAATARVKKHAAEGWDLLKILPGLSRSEFDAIAQQATLMGIEFSGHVPNEVGLDRVLASGMRTIEHLDGYILALGGETRQIADADLRDVAKRTKSAGVGVVPTMAVWETLLSIPSMAELHGYPELRYMPRDLVTLWQKRQNVALSSRIKNHLKTLTGGRDKRIIAQNRRRLLKIMDEEGVEILFGSDAAQRYSVPGFSILREMRAMSRSGLSNRRILETATSAAGAYFSERDKFGEIAVGARADLLLLNSNPIENLNALAQPAGLIVRGQWIDSKEMQKKLSEIAASRNR